MNQKVADLYQTVQDAENEITTLRQNIRGGKKTLGSKFDNFVFCAVGANPVDWMKFYQLDEQVKNSGGEEILIVGSKKEKENLMIEPCSGPSVGMGSSGGPPMNFSNTKYDMAYGILTGHGLDFDLSNAEIIFPNGRKYIHVSASTPIFGTSWTLEPLEVIRGRIRKEVSDLPNLYKSFSPELFSHWSGDQDSKILVGQEVEAYFENITSGKKAYSEIKKRL